MNLRFQTSNYQPDTKNEKPIFGSAGIITIGCRLNQAESDCLRGRLQRKGEIVNYLLRSIQFSNSSTVNRIYINTCAVTHQAEQSSLAMIRRVCRLRPKPRVVVLGCLAEKALERLREIPGVDEIWNNEHKQQLLLGQSPAPARSRALLKVQDGCDRHCGYCLVSHLRGNPVSLPMPQVLQQFEDLIAAGFQEIVLTGLNLGRYESNGIDLAGLLTTLLKKPGNFRIRLSSLEPDLFNERLVDVIADPKVCAHFHIPLQSGDDRILSMMGRCYTVNSYERLLMGIIRTKPDACIGTDVIVGFPGEDDESFDQTKRFLSVTGVNYLHVFPYSLRLGTPAARFGDPVSQQKKAERVSILRKLSQKKRVEYARRFCGQVRGAILEPDAKALTDNYLRLLCPDLQGKRYQPGMAIDIKVEMQGDRLIGRDRMVNSMEDICL